MTTLRFFISSTVILSLMLSCSENSVEGAELAVSGGIEVTPDLLRLGENWERSRDSRTITVSNHSSTSVSLIRVANDCACVSVFPQGPAGTVSDTQLPIAIDSNEKIALKVEFDYLLPAGPKKKYVDLEFNDGSKKRITIDAHVESIVEFEPSRIDLGQMRLGTSHERAITCTPHTDVQIISIRIPRDIRTGMSLERSLEAKPDEVASTKAHSWTLRIDTDMFEPGPIAAILDYQTDVMIDDQQRSISSRVIVQGTVVDKFWSNPRTISFGALARGEQSVESFAATALSSIPLNFKKPTIDLAQGSEWAAGHIAVDTLSDGPEIISDTIEHNYLLRINTPASASGGSVLRGEVLFEHKKGSSFAIPFVGVVVDAEDR